MAHWKDLTQYGTAVVAFASGVAMAFLQYFDAGDLTNGVLGYVAQVLVYAASIFGVTIYMKDKHRETMGLIDKRYNKIEEGIKNGEYSANVVTAASK